MNLRFYLNGLILFFGLSLVAQTPQFKIFGTVYNTDKKVVPNWTVNISGDPSAPAITLQTDSSGNYEHSFNVATNLRIVYQISVVDPCLNAPQVQKAEVKVGEERHDFVICANSNPQNPCDVKFTFAVHPDGTVEFHANPEIIGAKYFWDFGDGTTGEAKDINHLYANDNVYVVTLTLATATCKSQFIAKVEVKKTVTPPPPPQVNFDNGCCGKVHIGALVSPSATSPRLFGFNASGDYKINDVSWDFGDGSSGNGIDVKHAYAATGKYQVITTITGDFCKIQINTWIHVDTIQNPPPPNPCNIDFVFGVSNLSAKFLADFKGSKPDKISWDFGDGSTSTDAATSHTYANPGEYKVTLFVSINGQTCQVTKVIKVGSRVAPPNPNTSIVIYDVSPSPASDAVTVFIKSGIQAKTTLLVGDLANNNFIKQEVNLMPGDNQVPLNVSNLRPGVYMVYLYFDNKLVSKGKFQKI